MHYAILIDGTVENVIYAEDSTDPQVIELLIPEAGEIVAVTEITGPAHITGDMINGKFRAPSPFPSWIWNAETESWEAPLPYPTGGNGYTWDEQNVAWVEIPASDLPRGPLPSSES